VFSGKVHRGVQRVLSIRHEIPQDELDLFLGKLQHPWDVRIETR
jgi:hypothetical protein